MAKKAQAARFVQTMLINRQRFIPSAQRAWNAALNEQLKHVYAKVQHTHSSRDLEHLIKEEPLREAIRKTYTTAGIFFGKAQYEGLKPKRKGFSLTTYDLRLTTKSDFTDELDGEVQDFIAGQGAKMITAITAATRDSVRDWIATAIKNGTGAMSLAADLRKHFTDFNRGRSLRIAITETSRASNWAGQISRDMVARDFDTKISKTWFHAGSTPGDREDHVAADGQTVPNDDTFHISAGYAPDYPVDGSGDASDEVNCHCCVFAKVI